MRRIHSILIWPTATLRSLLYDRIPALSRFDAWANKKERQWHHRRNGPALAALRDAGLRDNAEFAAVYADLRDASTADGRRDELTRHARALAASAWDEGYWTAMSAAQGTYGDGVEAALQSLQGFPVNTRWTPSEVVMLACGVTMAVCGVGLIFIALAVRP